WRRERAALAAFGVAFVFLGLMLRSQRFVEYFAPTATFFVALAASATIAYLDRTRRGLLVLLLTGVLIANVVGIGSMLARRGAKAPYTKFQAAAELVAHEAPPGAMLCSTDWD